MDARRNLQEAITPCWPPLKALNLGKYADYMDTQKVLSSLLRPGDGIEQLLVAVDVHNHDLNERHGRAPFHLLGGAVAIDRTHVFNYVFLRHHVDRFHLARPHREGGSNWEG